MRKHFFGKRAALLLALAIAALSLGAAAQTAGDDLFDVTIAWVNGGSRQPENQGYAYHFVNSLTGEERVLTLDGVKDTIPSQDPRIHKIQGFLALPKTNGDGSAAIYQLSPQSHGYLVVEGIGYALSNSESQDPAAGTPYYSRCRVLTQQIALLATVGFEGIEPRPFDLTLRMESWAKGADGQSTHQATARIDRVPEAGINLVETFSQTPSDAVLFRHFTLADMSWDGCVIAGENRYTLEVGELPGLVHEITGNADEGFHIVFKAAQ